MLKTSRLWRAVFASLLWLISGSKVLGIAFGAWSQTNHYSVYIWLIGAWIFFHILIFPPVVKRNLAYLMERKALHPIYLCFRPATWLIMLFMMTLGIGLRYSGWVSDNFIAGFYTGLGIALLGCMRYYLREIPALARETPGQ